MKTKNKKIFGFGTVFLMTLVAIVPAIGGIKTINSFGETHQQSSQNIIYKEYYPDAPRDDPKVAYYIPNRVIVAFKESINVCKMEGIEVDGNWYVIKDRIPEENIVILEVTRYNLFEFIEKVESRDDVECADLDSVRFLCDSPNDPYYQNGSQWGIEFINCEDAWDVPRKMEYAWLTILDSGIDTDHEDLKSAANIYQWDFIENDEIANDETGHGTKVTGIALARMNNSKGIAGVAGGAPNFEVLKIFYDSGHTTISLVIEALIYSRTEHKAPSVICMSFGGHDSNTIEKRIFRRMSLIWGTLLVASVGNGGSTDYVLYPAAYNSVLGVGAVNESGELCRYPGNWGSNYNENRRQVDLVAPGINIITTTDPDIGGNKYDYFTGTSAAAPFVAGVAALWYGARAKVKGYNERINEPIKCMTALFSSAKLDGKDAYKYGHGIVNANNTVSHVNLFKGKTPIGFIQRLLESLPLLEKLLNLMNRNLELISRF